MVADSSPFPPLTLPRRELRVDATLEIGDDVTARAVLASVGQDVSAETGLDPARLTDLGFTASAGQTLVLTSESGPVRVVIGTGSADDLSAAAVRDAAAAFSLAVPRHTRLAFPLPTGSIDAAEAAAAAVEGAALARYSYRFGAADQTAAVDSLALVTLAEDLDAVDSGAQRGRVLVAAAELGRDLANAPGGMLTAVQMANIAEELGRSSGLEVEVFDEHALRELGCGGLLGVNLGSVDPPRMIKLTYRPAGEPTGRLTLVGKGIMYDSGGIALKPGDLMHAAMKNDMSGAGAVLASMSTLAALGCTAQVVGYLMCTDNMPSGSAMKLGDVLVTRGGKTIEVLNTDAEGRLVMADALVLATEEPTDAIVDIATLTGACMRALGTEVAGVMGNDQSLIGQIEKAAERTDEPVWQLPLAHRYRRELDSTIADIKNLGGPNAGAITAALFLAEFVGDTPWAHLDIAGTAQADAASGWRNKGATGFGTRLLIDLALNFHT